MSSLTFTRRDSPGTSWSGPRPGPTASAATGHRRSPDTSWPEARPADGLAVDFVVVSVPAQLSEIAQRVQDGRLRTHIGNVATLDNAVAALNPSERVKGKTIIHVRL
jgi:NADPH:quinone reductase-like Zn-dependent oxidoreductase